MGGPPPKEVPMRQQWLRRLDRGSLRTSTAPNTRQSTRQPTPLRKTPQQGAPRSAASGGQRKRPEASVQLGGRALQALVAGGRSVQAKQWKLPSFRSGAHR